MVRLSVSESSVDPSCDQFKLLSGLPESSSTRIDRPITFARLPTNGSEGARLGSRAQACFASLTAMNLGCSILILD